MPDPSRDVLKPDGADVARRHELFSLDHTMGHGDGRLRFEAWIEFGRATVERADRGTLTRFSDQVDRDRWAYSYVSFPFDLQPQQRGYYAQVRIMATFQNPDVIARYLAPSLGSQDLPFPGEARAAGLGRPVVRWDLTPAKGIKELPPQGHVVMCLLQRPKEQAATEVVLDVEATVVRTVVVVDRRTARTVRPARYQISFDDGTFNLLPG